MLYLLLPRGLSGYASAAIFTASGVGMCAVNLAMRLGFSSFIEFQTGVAVSFMNAVTTVAAITVS